METTVSQIKSYFSNFFDLSIYMDVPKVTQFISDHKLGVLISSTLALYGVWYLKRPRNLPPGPYCYPLIGSFPCVLKGNISESLNKLSKKYGDVFCLWFGGDNYCVFLNSYEAIKELYITRGAEFADRVAGHILPGLDIPDTLFNSQYDNNHKASRKIVNGVLRKLIPSSLGSIVEMEMNKIEQYICGRGTEIDVNSVTRKVFTNVTLGMLFKKNYPHNSPDLLEFIKDFEELSSGYVNSRMIEFNQLPSAIRFLFHGKIKKNKRKIDIIANKIKKYIEMRKTSPYMKMNEIHCIVDAYIYDTNLQLYPNLLPGTILALMDDAIVTSVDMCLRIFAYMLKYPEYQDKILSEIQELKGCNNNTSVADRAYMPITESFIMESLRIDAPFTTGFFVNPLKDATFKGLYIPAYVRILPNYLAVHFDANLFPEPHLFKPERFIKDGKIVKSEGFIPFGIGRRVCVGETIVRNLIFLYLTNIIQKYKITCREELPSLENDRITFGTPSGSKPFMVHLESRH